MITIRWETAAALFWVGVTVEAGLSNWFGRVSDARLLLFDLAVVLALLWPIRTARNGSRRNRS